MLHLWAQPASSSSSPHPPPPPHCCQDLNVFKKNPVRQQRRDEEEQDSRFLATRKHWCLVHGYQRDTDQCRACNTEGCISCPKPEMKRLQLPSCFYKGSAWLQDTSRSTRERDKEGGGWRKRCRGKCELSFTFNGTSLTCAASGISCQVHQMWFWQKSFSGKLSLSLSLTAVLDEKLIWYPI